MFLPEVPDVMLCQRLHFYLLTCVGGNNVGASRVLVVLSYVIEPCKCVVLSYVIEPCQCVELSYVIELCQCVVLSLVRLDMVLLWLLIFIAKSCYAV